MRKLAVYANWKLVVIYLYSKVFFSWQDNFLQIFKRRLYFRNIFSYYKSIPFTINLSLLKQFNLFQTFITMLQYDLSKDDTVISFDQKKNPLTKILTSYVCNWVFVLVSDDGG